MKVTIKFIVYIFTLLFLDDEMAPGTPNSHEMHQARSYFQPKLDLQRFQQYVAEEQSRYVEQPEQPHLNGCGPDHVALKGQGSDHLALCGHGNDHVTGHDSMLPGSAQDKPDLYPHASQPYFYPQGAVSTVGTIRNDQASGAFITGHGTDHVVPPGSVASRTDHASQQATFLSQESVEIVAGSGPSVVNPGTASLYVANCHLHFLVKKKQQQRQKAPTNFPSLSFSLQGSIFIMDTRNVVTFVLWDKIVISCHPKETNHSNIRLSPLVLFNFFTILCKLKPLRDFTES